jgi:predicted negative regulator of RcsB-dependent stress response
LPLANDARLELAESYAERGEFDPAVKLLNEALDKEPPADLSDKIHIRLGVCLAAKKEVKLALAQFEAVAQNPMSPLAGEAHYRAGECLLQQGEATEAVKRLVLFRDQQPFQNLPGLTDRALLRLGHAYAHLKQWDQSRQAYELVLARFGNSPWVHEARYGIGWAYQNKKESDNAVNAYVQVTAATVTEVAAKAQLQIGLCRLEQKRPADAAKELLVVPFTYDYPEWSAVALCEAARAFTELKQTDHAERLLKRVIRDHPQSQWAKVAKDRLVELKKG